MIGRVIVHSARVTDIKDEDYNKLVEGAKKGNKAAKIVVDSLEVVTSQSKAKPKTDTKSKSKE